ncbi:MAG: hypothetical protein AUG44_07745 [Actinobacteria bacterium 13_1_20CM_3_71_11]|nr:MAG: hypothetical protein AUG44_07745 [Actinobacteria bacterium 13_1_20CM_3_71_11]
MRAALAADDAGGQQPQLQLQGVRMLVAASDEASARGLLAAVDDAAVPVGGAEAGFLSRESREVL